MPVNIMEKTRNGLSMVNVKRLALVVILLVFLLHAFQFINPLSTTISFTRPEKTLSIEPLSGQNASSMSDNSTQIEPVRYEPEASDSERNVLNESTVVSQSVDGDLNVLKAENASGLDREQSTECLKYILYDKPVKTGSTAISKAIRTLLKRKFNETDYECSFPTCPLQAGRICEGLEKPIHLLGHITIPDEVFYCLRPMYYSITSIRDPEARWRSSYYYNIKVGGSHYGIAHNASYEEFMMKYPRCGLLNYYDGEGMFCDSTDEAMQAKVRDRIERIVARFDEIIDLDDEPIGPVEREIAEHLKEVNVAGGKIAQVELIPDRTRLDVEYVLYEALKEKRRKGGDERRVCILN